MNWISDAVRRFGWGPTWTYLIVVGMLVAMVGGLILGLLMEAAVWLWRRLREAVHRNDAAHREIGGLRADRDPVDSA